VLNLSDDATVKMNLVQAKILQFICCILYMVHYSENCIHLVPILYIQFHFNLWLEAVKRTFWGLWVE